MSNRRLNTRLPKPPATTISPRPQVVAHKSTGGILNSFPEPVDPVGNASQRLTNDTVALPMTEEVGAKRRVRDLIQESMIRTGAHRATASNSQKTISQKTAPLN